MAEQASNTVESTEVPTPKRLHQNKERRLALEIRSWRLGFAVFEGARLIDWGCRRYRDPQTAAQKVAALVTLFSPSLAVTRSARRVPPSAGRAITRKIEAKLKNQGIDLMILNRGSVRNYFASHGCRTKQEIATRLAQDFSLTWMVPKPRRPWNTEPHHMAIFDAIATDVAYNGILRYEIPNHG